MSNLNSVVINHINLGQCRHCMNDAKHTTNVGDLCDVHYKEAIDDQQYKFNFNRKKGEPVCSVDN